MADNDNDEKVREDLAAALKPLLEEGLSKGLTKDELREMLEEALLEKARIVNAPPN
jgi:hypothetical protein